MVSSGNGPVKVGTEACRYVICRYTEHLMAAGMTSAQRRAIPLRYSICQAIRATGLRGRPARPLPPQSPWSLIPACPGPQGWRPSDKGQGYKEAYAKPCYY